MKIAYVTFEAPGGGGVGRKIAVQSDIWRKRGHSVRNIVLRIAAGPDSDEIRHPVKHRLGPALPTAWANRRAIRRELSSFAPDIVYTRHGTSAWPGLASVFHGFSVVEEVNSDIVAELSGAGSHLKLALYKATRQATLGILAGAVFVTPELRERYAAEFARRDAPTIVISNGTTFPAEHPPKIAHARAQLVLVASSDQLWHGIDNFFALAGALPECDFHLIGPIERDQKLPNLTMHGRVAPEALARVYAGMDFGLAGLGMSRNGMAEACPLKVREYATFGLPTIGAYRDTDLHDSGYFLQVPDIGKEMAQTATAIREFVARWRGKPFPYEDAIRRLSFESKETERLAFFEKVRSAS